MNTESLEGKHQHVSSINRECHHLQVEDGGKGLTFSSDQVRDIRV